MTSQVEWQMITFVLQGSVCEQRSSMPSSPKRETQGFRNQTAQRFFQCRQRYGSNMETGWGLVLRGRLGSDWEILNVLGRNLPLVWYKMCFHLRFSSEGVAWSKQHLTKGMEKDTYEVKDRLFFDLRDRLEAPALERAQPRTDSIRDNVHIVGSECPWNVEGLPGQEPRC